VIPTNSFGNVEVWDGDERFVPRGCVLVDAADPALTVKVAQVLQIYHAPAVYGFTFNSKNKKMIASVGGVVVLAEDAVLLSESLASYMECENVGENNQENRKQKAARIVRKWESFARQLLTKESLRQLYGF
jgi:hypothetical protein